MRLTKKKMKRAIRAARKAAGIKRITKGRRVSFYCHECNSSHDFFYYNHGKVRSGKHKK